MKWVHSLNIGVDEILAKENFKNSDIVFSNSKGASNDILGEFIALGLLYNSKHVENFI